MIRNLTGRTKQEESPCGTLALEVAETASQSAACIKTKRWGDFFFFTYVTRSTAGRGHDAARSLNLGQTKVTDHDLGVLIHAVIQQILWLQRPNREDQRGLESMFFCLCFENCYTFRSLWTIPMSCRYLTASRIWWMSWLASLSV